LGHNEEDGMVTNIENEFVDLGATVLLIWYFVIWENLQIYI
jgi:hypothetical protein